MPNLGDKVYVRPAPEHCRKGAALSAVLADGATGRFLPVEGEAVVWNMHHAARLATGEIVVDGPALTPRELAPGEMLESTPLPPGVVELGSATPHPEEK